MLGMTFLIWGQRRPEERCPAHALQACCRASPV